MQWTSWVDDPLIAVAGITFDRTPAGTIAAPSGRVRVCAYHIDFDERPTCYVDVATVEEAQAVCADLGASCGWKVDYAVAFDDAGRVVVNARPY